MARTTRGPSHDPTRTQTQEPERPEEARTPPARPDERGAIGEEEREIAEGAPERTTRRTDLPRGTAFDSPETIPPGKRE